MWLDDHNMFARSIAIGGSTGKRLIGDVIDTDVARDVGSSDNLFFVVQVQTTFTSGGSGTLAVELASDAQAAIAVDDSATTHILSGTYAMGELTAGATLLSVKLPRETDAKLYERYLGVIADVGTAAMTAGALNAFLTVTPPQMKKYPDGAR